MGLGTSLVKVKVQALVGFNSSVLQGSPADFEYIRVREKGESFTFYPSAGTNAAFQKSGSAYAFQKTKHTAGSLATKAVEAVDAVVSCTLEHARANRLAIPHLQASSPFHRQRLLRAPSSPVLIGFLRSGTRNFPGNSHRSMSKGMKYLTLHAAKKVVEAEGKGLSDLRGVDVEGRCRNASHVASELGSPSSQRSGGSYIPTAVVEPHCGK